MTLVMMLLAVDPDADEVWLGKPLSVAAASHDAFDEGQRESVVGRLGFAFAFGGFAAFGATDAIDDACSTICL